MPDYRSQPVLTSLMLDWPPDWDALFGAARPIILDVGFGLGHTLAYLHRTYPDHNIVGIEIDNMCLTKAARAVVRDAWHNVRVVHAFAETALAHLFTPGSLAQVHVNFPDPWFKARHAGRRLMKRATLDAIVSRLAPGGTFYLATDIRDYAEMSHALLAETPGLQNTLPAPWVDARPAPFETKYERRAREQGRPCHYFVYRRNDQPAPQVPVLREQPMPNFVFASPLSLDDMQTAVETPDYHDDELTVAFLARYRGERAVLFEVFIREPTLDQRLALALVEKDDDPGVFTLKLSALGHPRPTDGVHRAARVLADGLVALHPETQVIHDKVRYALLADPDTEGAS